MLAVPGNYQHDLFSLQAQASIRIGTGRPGRLLHIGTDVAFPDQRSDPLRILIQDLDRCHGITAADLQLVPGTPGEQLHKVQYTGLNLIAGDLFPVRAEGIIPIGILCKATEGRMCRTQQQFDQHIVAKGAVMDAPDVTIVHTGEQVAHHGAIGQVSLTGFEILAVGAYRTGNHTLDRASQLPVILHKPAEHQWAISDPANINRSGSFCAGQNLSIIPFCLQTLVVVMCRNLIPITLQILTQQLCHIRCQRILFSDSRVFFQKFPEHILQLHGLHDSAQGILTIGLIMDQLIFELLPVTVCTELGCCQPGPIDIGAAIGILRIEAAIGLVQDLSIPGQEEQPLHAMLLCIGVDELAVACYKQSAVDKTELISGTVPVKPLIEMGIDDARISRADQWRNICTPIFPANGIAVDADFESEKMEILADITLAVCPLRLLIAGVILLLQFLKIYRKTKPVVQPTKEKGGKLHEQHQ